jgi:steroid delta-isomerase-like uncharacterized protein
VAAFYERIWNAGDLGAASDLLTPDFSFRGSLGSEMQGRDAFLDYVRSIRGALADYRCDLSDCVAEGDQAFAKLIFSGRHVGLFRGYAPTGKTVSWLGAALFRFRSERIASVWVLGDVAGLDAALRENQGGGRAGPGGSPAAPFDGQPTLRGSLVELRPLRPEDYAALYAVAADPLIWEQHPAHDRHEEARFREFFAEALASRGALLVTDARTRRAVGSSRFHGYSEATREVEIGWTFLARSHWGGRYNGELKQLMLGHAFRFADSVVLFVSPGNLRSRRAVEKIGGVREPEPDAEGRVVYRIRAGDFRSRACAAIEQEDR